MKYNHLILEKKEYVCIKRVLNLLEFNQNPSNKESLSKLLEELITAEVLDEKDMPLDVIRLNSRVRVQTKNGWKEDIQVVLPNEGDLSKKKISILKPMGAALIGYAQDDIVTWQFPMGVQEVQIVSVLQDKSSNKLQIII